MGDLNYRLDCLRDTALEFVQEGNFTELLKFDQLFAQMKSELAFNGFYEATLTFPPTYKYDPGTNIYDTR
jgi:phosphatidylinositol-bisphosphatase